MLQRWLQFRAEDKERDENALPIGEVGSGGVVLRRMHTYRSEGRRSATETMRAPLICGERDLRAQLEANRMQPGGRAMEGSEHDVRSVTALTERSFRQSINMPDWT